MFGRATITLGIGHILVDNDLNCKVLCMMFVSVSHNAVLVIR